MTPKRKLRLAFDEAMRALDEAEKGPAECESRSGITTGAYGELHAAREVVEAVRRAEPVMTIINGDDRIRALLHSLKRYDATVKP